MLNGHIVQKITALFRIPFRTGLLIAVALAQIGEFSFVLAALGAALGLVGALTYNLILAAALVSIALNPLLFRLADPPGPRPGAAP